MKFKMSRNRGINVRISSRKARLKLQMRKLRQRGSSCLRRDDEIPEGECITSQVKRIEDRSLENTSIQRVDRGSKTKSKTEK